MAKTKSLYLTWSWIGTGTWQTRRTERRTDRITAAKTRYSYASSRAQKAL